MEQETLITQVEQTLSDTRKAYEELELSDDFMFGKVMENKELCKRTLEVLLDITIEDITYPELQKSINITYEGKSIRLDLYVEDEKETVYNGEMQRKKKTDRTISDPNFLKPEEISTGKKYCRILSCQNGAVTIKALLISVRLIRLVTANTVIPFKIPARRRQGFFWETKLPRFF